MLPLERVAGHGKLWWPCPSSVAEALVLELGAVWRGDCARGRARQPAAEAGRSLHRVLRVHAVREWGLREESGTRTTRVRAVLRTGGRGGSRRAALLHPAAVLGRGAPSQRGRAMLPV